LISQLAARKATGLVAHDSSPAQKFVEIPNLTPAFDPQYLSNGLIEKAIDFVLNFADAQVSGIHPRWRHGFPTSANGKRLPFNKS
jgi:hypothetical protein